MLAAAPASVAALADAQSTSMVSSTASLAASWKPHATSSNGTSLVVPGKVTARLLAELQGAQQASEVECRLLTGVADLFAELADEERRRRTSWEERTERSMRDLRASVDADLARSACEARRLLSEARRDAQEAVRLSKPCHDLLAPSSPGEEPGAGLVRLVSREAQMAARAEAERTLETVRAHLGEAVSVRQKESFQSAIEEHSDIFQKAMREEGGRWAEACASQIADGLLHEQQARELLKVTLDTRIEQTETLIGSHLQELKDANATLQNVLERYADRWDTAWREEAEGRATADCETVQRLEALARACEAQRLSTADQQGVTKLRNDIEDALARLRAATAETHVSLRTESEVRGSSDARLAASLEQLRALVSKVVAVMEDQHHSDPPGFREVPLPKPTSRDNVLGAFLTDSTSGAPTSAGRLASTTRSKSLSMLESNLNGATPVSEACIVSAPVLAPARSALALAPCIVSAPALAPVSAHGFDPAPVSVTMAPDNGYGQPHLISMGNLNTYC